MEMKSTANLVKCTRHIENENYRGYVSSFKLIYSLAQLQMIKQVNCDDPKIIFTIWFAFELSTTWTGKNFARFFTFPTYLF